jgi:hypothetical protein
LTPQLDHSITRCHQSTRMQQLLRTNRYVDNYCTKEQLLIQEQSEEALLRLKGKHLQPFYRGAQLYYCPAGTDCHIPSPPPQPWQDPDLWTCPVNPHLMHIGCNIYLFIYHHHPINQAARSRCSRAAAYYSNLYCREHRAARSTAFGNAGFRATGRWIQQDVHHAEEAAASTKPVLSSNISSSASNRTICRGCWPRKHRLHQHWRNQQRQRQRHQ